MFSTDDTIVAVATPEGRSGLGVVRLSGPDARDIARRLLGRSRDLSPRLATFSRLRRRPASGCGAAGPLEAFDQVVAVYFAAPRSYTGEDVVEISAHGNPLLLRGIVEEAVRAGARLARPGEFTLRAHLNGRLDLVQAEAVADLVDAVTPAQAALAFDQLEGTLTGAIAEIEGSIFELVTRLEASLDFPEEGYHFIEVEALPDEIHRIDTRVQALLASSGRGRVLREGRLVALVGRPNAGKSSLFNALIGTERAIVTSQAGTTRDLLTESLDMEGVPVTLVDTAGLRDVDEEVEIEGVRRARQAAERAELVVVVVDRSRPLTEADDHLLAGTVCRPHVVAASKSDLPHCWHLSALPHDYPVVEVSARTGVGVSALASAVARRLVGDESWREAPTVSNTRHICLLRAASEHLARAAAAAGDRQPEELVLADLQDALGALAEVTGKRTPDDVLEAIFSRFCIGK
jgi:tRNA modification GTPase